MVKPTGPTNPYVRKVIADLEKKYRKTKIPLFKDLAERLMKPRRKGRSGVNLSKLEKYAREDEVAIVPDKLLGAGILSKKITVVALHYSKVAKEKIEANKGNVMLFDEFIEKAKKPLKVRIIE
ncbi:MAG: 50S ribosomal protein L18e [Candidatus Nanohaloarchaeota archaeon]|nr:50S ribosomal protein L18e [Candidatus Nanohaloarchaeota archaeon]